MFTGDMRARIGWLSGRRFDDGYDDCGEWEDVGMPDQ